MSDGLDKWRSRLDKGIDTFNPDFDAELSWDETTHSVTSGIVSGTGPRYGMAPLVNHNHNEAPGASGTGVISLPGIRRAENTAGNGAKYLKKIFAIVPIPLVPHWTFTGKAEVVYFAVIGLDRLATKDITSGYIVDIQPLSEYDTAATNGPYRYQQRTLAHGMPQHVYDQVQPLANGYTLQCVQRIQKTEVVFVNNQRVYDLLTLACGKTAASDVPFLSTAVFISSDKLISNAWIVATATNATALHAPKGAFIYRYPGGVPVANYPEFLIAKRYDVQLHSWHIYGLNRAAGSPRMEADYAYNTMALTDTIVNGVTYDPTATNASATTARLDAVAAVYGNIETMLIWDESLKTRCGYKAILCAGTRPFALLIQEWIRNDNQAAAGAGGSPHQWVDLCRPSPIVAVRATQLENAGTPYFEDGTAVNTCWSLWPSFVSGTALATSAATAFSGVLHVRLGAPDSGVLRAFTVYEFAFSIYDKSIDYESNVGLPAKIQTGGDDLVAITLVRDAKNGGGVFMQGAGTTNLPFTPTTIPEFIYENNYELRVYYREFGTAEWMLALGIDYNKYAYWPNRKELWMCTGPLAALPGGRVGGFVDYSPLQDGTWTCALTYKNRAFWIGTNGLTFSLINNIFAYPARNYQTIPTGELRGGIIHNYPGQSEQSARLIVVGTDTIYVGRFTGDKFFEPVRVSIDNVGSYPVDGSDFVLDAWTSSTAFSYRSMCIADGILHWWGPGGIYRDDGTNTPPKISIYLEPDIFELYDPNYVGEIHSVFNDRTKEIIWFYRAPGVTTSRAIIYNTQTEEFLFVHFDCAIDAAWNLEVADAAVNSKVTGKRTMISVRDDFTATTQNAVYFDHLNRSGDVKRASAMLVKTVADSGSSKLLTLAAGAPAAGIAVGDYIAIHQANKYNVAAGAISEQIAKVAAINLPTSITVTLAPAATLPNFAAGTAYQQFIPIWHSTLLGAGLNGIPFQIRTNYWMPAGEDYNGIWQWIYLRAKLDLWPSTDPQLFSLGYRTPVSLERLTELIALEDNSDGHFQLFHPMQTGDEANQGQAVEITLSGYHIGSKLTFEMIGLYGVQEDGNVLKRFEG